MSTADTSQTRPDQRVIPIFIDQVRYDAPAPNLTGAQLRALANPAVPEDRDLFLEVPGPKDDLLIDPVAHYEIKPGSHYYTAPKTINPGGRTNAASR